MALNLIISKLVIQGHACTFRATKSKRILHGEIIYIFNKFIGCNAHVNLLDKLISSLTEKLSLQLEGP